MVIPTKEMNEAIRQEIIAQGGTDPGPSFKVGHISATFEDEMPLWVSELDYQKKLDENLQALVKETARMLVAIENGDYEDMGPVESGLPQRDVRDIVKELIE